MNRKTYRADPRDHDAVAKALLQKMRDQDAADQAVTKPVRLQVNTSGAWKDVVRFDADNTRDTDLVTDGAEALGLVGGGAITFRIVSDDALVCVLFNWKHGQGWKEAGRG